MKIHRPSTFDIPKLTINPESQRMPDLVVVDLDMAPTDWMVIISGAFHLSASREYCVL